VTDDWETISSYTKSIRVDAAPTAQIVVVPNQTTGVQVQFDSTSSDSDGTVASYAWDFGDGTNGTGATPAHTYAQAGSYAVKLVVTDNDGATGSAEVTVNVADAQTSTGGGTTGGGTNTGGGTTGGGTTGIPTDPAPGGPVGDPADKTAPALVVPAKLKAKKKAGKLTYVVSTNEAATIVAKLSGKVAGAATVKIANAGSGKVVIKLSSKAKKALRAAKAVKLTLVTTATDAAGNRTSKTTKVVLV
jgi:PKD repeat protein